IPNVINTSSDVGISRVVLGSIDNRSLVSFNAYTDYTSQYSTHLDLGGSYGITLERLKGINPMTRRVWIDWNQDGDFSDKGEMVAEEINKRTLSWTDTFLVPKTALYGATRMRIGTGL